MVWSWIDNYKDRIITVSTFLQACAVVGGVWFGLSQFVFSDETAQRVKTENTMRLFDKFLSPSVQKSQTGFASLGFAEAEYTEEGLHFTTDDQLDRFNTAKPRHNFYKTLDACIRRDVCEKKLALEFFCFDINVDSQFLLLKLQRLSGKVKTYEEKFIRRHYGSVFRLADQCAKFSGAIKILLEPKQDKEQ